VTPVRDLEGDARRVWARTLRGLAWVAFEIHEGRAKNAAHGLRGVAQGLEGLAGRARALAGSLEP
jgi:hypothetical protein